MALNFNLAVNYYSGGHQLAQNNQGQLDVDLGVIKLSLSNVNTDVYCTVSIMTGQDIVA